MNTSFPCSPGSAELPIGRLTWSSDGRVSVVRPDGHVARAGDGAAAAIARLIQGEISTDPLLTARTDAPLEMMSGHERALADDVDMTNWNLVVDERVIVKVTSRLGDGDRAVRLVRAIARHEPDTVPVLHGTLELRTTDRRTVVATATALVPGAVDGWTWAVDDLLGHVEGEPAPSWPHGLGGLIARMHRALSLETHDDDAVGEHATEVDHAWRQLADRSAHGDAVGVRLAARLEALTAALNAVPPVRARRFAVHGDLHVGQVLRDPAGHVRVIDFDGDPQSTEGLDSTDAAVDIAHLLVSIDLVGAIVAKRLQRDDPRIIAWCTAARRQFLEAYSAELLRIGCADLLDTDRLPGLEAVQLVSELTYARDFLPRWEYAPDWAISHRYPPSTDTEDAPWTPPALPTT